MSSWVQGHRIMVEDDEGNFIYMDLKLTSEELDFFRELVDSRSNCKTTYQSSFEAGRRK